MDKIYADGDTVETSPTRVEYNNFQAALDHFNDELFGGELPHVLFSLRTHGLAYGYFSRQRYKGRDGTGLLDEIAMHPGTFEGRTDQDICATLVHEQVHQWQAEFGTRESKRAYHDKEFALKMKAVGLYPSNNGLPGGKETGTNMHHYIIDGGPFAQSYARLAATGFRLNWQSRESTKGPTEKKLKASYKCDQCGFTAWAKSGGQIACLAVSHEPRVMIEQK